MRSPSDSPSRRSRSSSPSPRLPSGPPVQAGLFNDDIPRTQRWGELWAARNGHALVAGVDEAGRGPLAGPVVAAAVCLPKNHTIVGLKDSKKLSARRREELFPLITAQAHYAIEAVGHDRIDAINILRATLEAMAAAIRGLCAGMGRPPDCVLVDGIHTPSPRLLGVSVLCLPVKHGDARSENVAAASILAKVTRDRMMAAYDGDYRGYGFAKHKGYGTREHMEALAALGPCRIHRRSFAGIGFKG